MTDEQNTPQAEKPPVDLYFVARDKIFREMGKQPPDDNARPEPTNPIQTVANAMEPASELWRSVGGGIAKAGFETYDFLAGEPPEADKSQLRRDIERRDAELRAASPVNALASGISQFATGMIGAGKALAPLKAAQKLKTAGQAGRLAYETTRGAIAGGGGDRPA